MSQLKPVKPYWLTIAEKYLGVKEIPGSQDNPQIVKWAQTCTLKASDDETPWCSEFVNGVMIEAGIKGTNSAAAKSWLEWGQPLESGRLGAITVLTRPGGNHVGFYLDESENRVKLLGGNQNNQVGEGWYPWDSVMGFRWPAGYPLDESEPVQSQPIPAPNSVESRITPAEFDLARRNFQVFQKAGNAYKWPEDLAAAMRPAWGNLWMTWVLMGIASRESRFGLLLDADGLGDSGHGHGVMQIDDRSHSAFCESDNWQDLAASLTYVHQVVIIPSFNYLGTNCWEALGEDYPALFWASIAAYNCGPGNVRKALEAGDNVDARTTGKDYSADVRARALALKETLA